MLKEEGQGFEAMGFLMRLVAEVISTRFAGSRVLIIVDALSTLVLRIEIYISITALSGMPSHTSVLLKALSTIPFRLHNNSPPGALPTSPKRMATTSVLGLDHVPLQMYVAARIKTYTSGCDALDESAPGDSANTSNTNVGLRSGSGMVADRDDGIAGRQTRRLELYSTGRTWPITVTKPMEAGP